jgi:hypothetical protein
MSLAHRAAFNERLNKLKVIWAEVQSFFEALYNYSTNTRRIRTSPLASSFNKFAGLAGTLCVTHSPSAAQ